MLIGINDGFVTVITLLGKGIAFGFGHEIFKHKQVLFTGFYIFGAIQIVGATACKFYPRYSTPNIVVKRMPLSKAPYDTLR